MSQRKPDETVALTCVLPEHEVELLRKELSAEVYQLEAIERDANKREWVLRRTDTREAVRVEPLSAVDAQEEMFS